MPIGYARSMRRLLLIWLVASCCPSEATKPAATASAQGEPRNQATPEERHFKDLQEITFGGDNAEAYWSFGGDRLIFQTNHKPYKCDQIEMMPANGGPSKLISTGKGRTTCSYFLKGDQEIIYASTHEASPECPTPPDMSKGYNWGLFEYDIYKANADGSNLRKLTGAPGYDAEATVCPADGSIIFTSERSGDLELWRMDANGGNLRQLTNTPGYDGGAFFSQDCTKIVWRASRPQGADLDKYKALLAQHLVQPTKMDLWVANADGTEAHQVTYLPGASFGPYFFPSGKRIIFASNYLAPRGPEFDLFAINTDGTQLERITYAPGFDGFPVFSPDGKTLSMSSNRRDVVKTNAGDVYRVSGAPAGAHDTNMFITPWDDHPAGITYQPETTLADEYAAAVQWLADDAREGRGLGTKGLGDAQDWVQQQFAAAGVEPGLDGAQWRQPFEVTTEIKRGANTALAIDGKEVAIADFAPMPFSTQKPVTGAVVAADWGIVDEATKRDDYKGKNVTGKIVLVHRFAPADSKDAMVTAQLGDLRKKAFTAKQKGAIGMIVVDDGDLKQDEAALPALVPGGMGEVNGATGDAGIAIVVIKRTVAAALAKGAHRVALSVELQPVRTPTANVVGVIHAGAATKQPGVVILGAHLDHLGMGGGSNALDPKVHAVHNGADDNASGVAALLQAAKLLAATKGELQRDVVVIAFSGEESGDLGSAWYVKHMKDAKDVVAMINMDMVGRMRANHLSINGGESAKEWKELAEPACAAARVDCTIGGSGYGPSDHMPFYIAGIPVLFMFTGNHLDYHTATDDSDKINAAGGSRVAMIVADLAKRVANRAGTLTYVKAPPEHQFGDVRHIGASLGTIPSYSEDPNQLPGLVLSDVAPDGPAAKAGLKGGDRIIKVGAVEIRGIEDLMFVLQAAKPGTPTKITFVRNTKEQTVDATFGVPRGRR
jgi:Tol biopolymer transport system component/Iap family predicted aminopeptidase